MEARLAGTGTIAGIMKSVLLKTEELKFFCAARCFATLRGPQVVEVTPGEWDFERERDRARAFVLPLPLFWNGSELGACVRGVRAGVVAAGAQNGAGGHLALAGDTKLVPGAGEVLRGAVSSVGFCGRLVLYGWLIG